MTEAQSLFETLIGKYEKREGVAQGKMMSSPALQFKKKVFVFFHNEKMTFKLGKDFDATAYGIETFEHLSPFKNKAPMKAWFMLPYSEAKYWDDLTALALEKIKENQS